MSKSFKVAVLGAAGGIGQPLSLLLKNSDYVSELVLFDVVNVAGVAADLSHIESPAKVVGVTGSIKDPVEQNKNLREALKGVEVAVIPAGIPRKPGMTRDDLFKINAGIVKGLIEGIADAAPDCTVCIISNPVNATVPIAAEVLKAKLGDKFNPKKLFGVSTLDVVRSNTFVSEALGTSVQDSNITVIGGHSGETILPLLKDTGLSADKVAALTKRIQNAGTEVVEAKQGAGSATLSMAYAGARFAISVLKAKAGETGVVECCYVPTDAVPGVEYFALPVTLGAQGAEKVHKEVLSSLSDFESGLLNSNVIPQLKASIAKGVDFVSGNTLSR